MSLLVIGQEIKIGSFALPASLWDSSTKTLSVKRTGESTYLTPIRLSRPNLPVWTVSTLPFNVEVEVFAIKNGNQQSIKISDEIIFTTSDFISGTSTSDYKYPILKIPSGFIGEDGGEMVLKWRYYKQNYPVPDDSDGWTEWYTFNFEVNLVLEALDPTFSGPESICDEGVFTITNRGTVTLENADNIATLTNLGGNQYKVTRIGNANGKVNLKSVSGSNTFMEAIYVGTVEGSDITTSHSGKLEPNTIYSFTVPSGYNVSSYNWTVTGGVILSGGNSNIVEIRTNPNPNQTDNNFSLSLTFTAECGSGTIHTTRSVASGGGGSPIEW